MARITVVGSLNMDLVARSPRIPRPGETITGSDFATHPGGKGANQAVAAARAGADVRMVGCVGQDDFGNNLLAALAEAGVDGTAVKSDTESATGVALIIVEENGQNSIVLAPGANHELLPEDVEAAESQIADADILLLQLEVPLAVVVRAAEIAKDHGVTVILNPAPAQKLPDALLAVVDVLIPNETEAELLTGLTIDTEDEILSAAQKLQQMGPSIVVLTLGAKGAFLCEEHSTSHIQAFDVATVDTTAAGDAFVGAFAVAIANGFAPSEAVRWGSAAGALAATKAGAQPSLPTQADIITLLAEHQA